MPHKEKFNVLQKKKAQYCELMKRSFEIALDCRQTSDKLNAKALDIKEEIDLLRSQINPN